MGTIEDFNWVEQEHRDTLSGGLSAWGEEWPEHLSRLLDRRWPNWPEAEDAERQEWLGARVQALPLGWVTEDQRSRLAGLADGRGEWRDWLPEQLDEWWPEWDRSTPDELTTWLEGMLAAAAPDPRDLGWVTEAHQATLAALTPTRGAWTDWLPGQLDQWWPGWDRSTPDELVPWLDQALPALRPAPDSADARELGWVTADQRTFLESLTGSRGDWPDWLPGQLDQWWPGWDRSTPDELVPWLNQALPSLTPQGLDADTGVEDLGWLTDGHRTQLDELYEIRGDWAQWLPGELDDRWPEWRRSTPEVLGPWLDGILPGLVLPDEAGEILDQVAKPALAALYDRIDEMAAELGMTPEELAAEIQGLPSEFFTEIVVEELAAA